jgi:hypothetical protein
LFPRGRYITSGERESAGSASDLLGRASAT